MLLYYYFFHISVLFRSLCFKFKLWDLCVRPAENGLRKSYHKICVLWLHSLRWPNKRTSFNIELFLGIDRSLPVVLFCMTFACLSPTTFSSIFLNCCRSVLAVITFCQHLLQVLVWHNVFIQSAYRTVFLFVYPLWCLFLLLLTLWKELEDRYTPTHWPESVHPNTATHSDKLNSCCADGACVPLSSGCISYNTNYSCLDCSTVLVSAGRFFPPT